MKALVVYTSMHKGNTKRIAEAIASVLKADLKQTADCKPQTLDAYDIIGFGSGWYGFKPDPAIVALITSSAGKGKKAFAFTTSGSGKAENNRKLTEPLAASGYDVIGDFSCKGFTTWGPFKLFGGASKGRPNEEDIEAARKFAKSLS